MLSKNVNSTSLWSCVCGQGLVFLFCVKNLSYQSQSSDCWAAVVWCCGVVLVVYRRVWYYKWCSDRRDQFHSSAWCCWSLISQCCVTVVISPPTFAYSQSSQLLMSCSRDISQVLTNNLKSSVKSVMRLSRVHLPTLLQTLISSQQLQTYFQNYSWLNLNE